MASSASTPQSGSDPAGGADPRPSSAACSPAPPVGSRPRTLDERVARAVDGLVRGLDPVRADGWHYPERCGATGPDNRRCRSDRRLRDPESETYRCARCGREWPRRPVFASSRRSGAVEQAAAEYVDDVRDVLWALDQVQRHGSDEQQRDVRVLVIVACTDFTHGEVAEQLAAQRAPAPRGDWTAATVAAAAQRARADLRKRIADRMVTRDAA
jgi:hypothetical protein